MGELCPYWVLVPIHASQACCDVFKWVALGQLIHWLPKACKIIPAAFSFCILIVHHISVDCNTGTFLVDVHWCASHNKWHLSTQMHITC